MTPEEAAEAAEADLDYAEEIIRDFSDPTPFRSPLYRKNEKAAEKFTPLSPLVTGNWPAVPSEVLVAMCDYIEAYVHKNRRPPKVSELQEYSKLHLEHVYNLLENPHSPLSVRLERRGLPTPISPEVDGVNAGTGYESWLTPQQVAAINCIIDFRDIRTVDKKLEQIGISTQKYRGWLTDPQFKTYLMSRAEAAIQNYVPEMHGKVIELAQDGDMKAIKLFYELAGRVDRSPKAAQVQVNNFNQNETFTKLVEAVQRHVKDKKVLAAIAREFDQLTGGMAAGTSSPQAKGLPSGN